MQRVSPFVKTAMAWAVGTSALLATTAVQAVVVFTPVNITVPATTGGIYVNVITGATGTMTVPAGWDINPWGSGGLGFFSPQQPAGGTYVMLGGSTSQVANLAPGALIGASSTFGSGASTAANAVQWNLNSSNNYFGFRFLNEANSQVHYGFAQLQIGSSVLNRSIIAIAYENAPGVAIGVVPEPGTYALMGLGLAGLMLAARRRKPD